VDVIESKLLRAFAREFGQTPIPPSCFDNVKQQQREQQREEPVVALPTAERKEGDAIREAVRKILDGMPRLPRSPEQAGVHEAVIAEWTDAARDPETNVGSLLMRRSVALPPKYRTCAVAIFAAAFMWTQPNADIRVNSTSERVAAVILRMVRSMLRPLAGSGNDGFFVSQSRDRLVIRTPDGGTAILDSRVVAPAPRPNAPLPRPQAQLRPQMPLVWQGAAVAPPPMVMALMFGPPPPGTR
jgi:hypothetical protein